MNKDTNRILEIADEFLTIPSTVGNEKPFLEHMNKLAKKKGYNTIIRNNYLTIKPKDKNCDKLFSIHIDRQGLITNDENKIEYGANLMKKKCNLSFRREEQEEYEKELKEKLNQYLKNFKVYLDDIFLRFKSESDSINFFRQDGPNDAEKIALRYVKENVISYDEVSGKKLNRFKVMRYDLDWKNHSIYFTLDNTPSKNEKKFMLESSISIFENKFSGQIDNVISAATIFYMIESATLEQEAIFTCGEEFGNSHHSIIDYYKEFDIKNKNLIILDTSPYADFIDKDEGFLVLRYGDERNGFDQELTNEIKKKLEIENIAFEFKPSFMGRTELGKVSKETKGLINGTTLQIPTTNYHTTYETATLASLRNYFKIIHMLQNK